MNPIVPARPDSRPEGDGDDPLSGTTEPPDEDEYEPV